MALVLRSQKGSALTHQEMDGNFTTLQQGLDALPAPIDPADVDSEKQNEVIAANVPAYVETNPEVYSRRYFSYYPNGLTGGGAYCFTCKPVVYYEGGQPTQVHVWERTQIN